MSLVKTILVNTCKSTENLLNLNILKTKNVMRNKLTLVNVVFAVFFSVNIFAQTTETIKVTINGVAKIDKATDNSGISVVIKSYYIQGINVFGVDKTVVTDINGNYTTTFDIPVKLCYGTICADKLESFAAIPLYITYSFNSFKDSINENIPLSKPYTDFSNTITKTPVLGAYVPQICFVSVDTAINKTFLAWNFPDGINIKGFNILKSTTFDGVYSVIDNVSKIGDYSVYRDMQSLPGKSKSFYKIQAVYTDNSTSPESYPKTPLGLSITPNGTNQPDLKIVEKSDIALFDHGLYTTISVLSSFNKSAYVEFKKFDIIGGTGLLEMLAGLQAEVQASAGLYSYMAVGTLVNECYSSKFKSDSGPFSQSLSNLAESEIVGSDIVNALELTTGPNPSKGIVTITIPESGVVNVFDETGKIVFSETVIAGQAKIDLKVKGVYYIVLNATKAYKSKVVIE